MGPPVAPPPKADNKPQDTPQVPDESKKAEARAHFEKGLTLLQEEAWAAALAEFLTSRELYPTRAATNNAAVSLRKLQRFDESLDMFETLLRDFPNIPPNERTAAQKEVAELRELVGTVEINGAEPGALITIGGQAKGEYPPISPLRVPAGTHLVRVFKEGFEPFETRVDVAGGQAARVTAKLRALTASGRLKVVERSGRGMEVVVDGVTVGPTPWEGTVSVGNHTVILRGKGRIGTQPVAAKVKSRELTALSLNAEELDSALRVEPTPPGATVAIDGVPVGNGVWVGWLKAGAHKVEVTTEGFLPVARDLKLERGGREQLAIKLERDPNAAMWRKPSRWVFEVNAGFAIVPSFGGEVAGGCTGACSSSLGLGGLGMFHAGYQLGSGFGFGLGLGYLFSTQSITGRATELVPYARNGLPPPQKGTADDQLRWSSFLGGASIFYRLGDKVPLLFRLGVGVMVGRLRDERKGTFKTSAGKTYDAFTVADVQTPISMYIDPEVRVGVRLGEHVDLSAGVQVLMMLAIKRPSWNQAIEVSANTDGVGTYASQATLGQFVLGIVPSAAFRYDF